MQNAPGFPTDLTSVTPAAEVRVNGALVDFETVSAGSTLQSAMPSHVAAAGGAVAAATGDATILPNADIVESPANPWNGSAPSQMANVTVDAGYEGATCRVFTGVVDATSGAPSSTGINVGLIDAIDQLDKKVTWGPLLNAAPSLTEGDWTFRRAGLSPIHITDKALRHCGFYATPRLSGAPVMSASMMGSAWPERGTLKTAAAHSNPSSSAAWVTTHWGVGLGNGVVSFIPADAKPLDSEFQMTFCRSLIPTNTGQSASFTVYWGTAGLQVLSSSGGHIYARHISTAGTVSNVATMVAADAASADTFNVRWIPGGNVTIYASNGRTATGTRAYPPIITTSPMTSIDIVTPQGSMVWGGFQASFSLDPTWAFERTAHLTAPAFIYGLTAFPAMIDRSCADILKEQAEAELAAMWLDEYGHFRWVNRDVLTGTTPVGTLTSLDHLFDLPWETPSKSVYSKVTVASDAPTVTRRAWSNLKVWQGSSGTMENLDTDTETIEPPANEDWFQVASPVRPTTAGVNAVKYGRGSLYGGILVSDGVENRWATLSELVQVFGGLPGGRFKITSSAAPIITTDVIEQRIFGTEYGSYHNANLPILRGKAKTVWDEKLTTGTAAGPAGAPELQHPVGPWIQSEDELTEFANWLAEQVTASAPIIRDVPIVPDTRIQKGDVMWLEDTDAYQVRLKVVVMGTSLTISAGPPVTMEQSVTCRIISMTRSGVSLDEHDAVWAGKSLNQHDVFWSGSTLDQHDANPLAH